MLRIINILKRPKDGNTTVKPHECQIGIGNFFQLRIWNIQ
jgi:hypothetical protein